MNTVTIPDSLREARRELESVPGYRLLEDWSWLPSLHRWALRFRLSCALPDTRPIPGETDWVVCVSSAYPWGDITVYPAKQNGIVETFPHQSLNELGLPDLPNRTGGLCLGIMTQAWQIRQGLSEPHTVKQRLQWHVERTVEWIERASRQLLFQPGDDWEAPARSFIATAPHVVIGRTASSLALSGVDRHGIVEILMPRPNLSVLFADRFIGATEEALRASRELGLGLALGQTEWGALVNRSTLASYGIWIRLAKAPVMPHWRLPSTWGELREWYQTHEGGSLDSKIADALHRGETVAQHLAFLLIGYPVPLRFGEQSARLQWEACSLEGLSEEAAFLGCPDAKPLKWATVYSNRDLMSQVRGQFGVGFCHSSALLIGAGALGSITAELLTRGGLRQLCIADSETLQLGNLVRHTLTGFNVGHNKAVAVAARLNASSLDAKVTAYQGKLSSQTLPELMAREPDIVLDTTGSDQVLSDLAGWQRPTLFLSISLGLHARRIYAYAARGEGFPVEDFHSKIQRWLRQDHEDTKDLPQPATEGIGCWSPVFPARLDDIYLLAAAVVKWMEEVATQPPLEPMLAVFEKDSGSSHFIGVRRVQ